jgi:lambda family phage portal protein
MPTFRERITAGFAAFKKGNVTASGRAPMPPRHAHTNTREYAGARYDRLTEDWYSPLTTGDAEMKTRIRTLRGRARELERNEPYTGRFLTRLVDNVYDHHGMTFTSLAGEWRNGKDKGLTYYLDKNDAKVIEIAYTEWRKNASITGNMTLNELGRTALRSTARDGDMIAKKIIGNQNKFGFSIQALEADMIDDYRNDVPKDQGAPDTRRQTRMGVEVNGYMMPVAYWILEEHPGDMQWWQAQGYWSKSHPARDFIHPFHRTRFTQVRDVTWLCSVMRDLKMLDGYDEAAIVAARTGAAKMGFITRDYNDPGDPYTGEQGADPAMGGDKAMDAEPGLIEDLSQTPGLKFEKWDPAYPHEQYADFIRTRVRRIGAGLDTSYYALANDLTDVNFSSIRAGLLEDREHYKALQTWWIAHFESQVFSAWLEIALLNGTIRNPVSGFSLPFSKLSKFEQHRFRPRRWPWVDPEKDATANKIAVDNRFKSRSEVIEETSQNTFEDIITEQAMEQELAEQMGVELPPVADKMHPGQATNGVDGAAAESTTENKKAK